MLIAMVGSSDQRIWGLTTEERLKRSIRNLDGVDMISAVAAMPEEGSIVLIRADHAIEERLIVALIEHEPGIILTIDGENDLGKVAVAGHVDVGDVDEAVGLLTGPGVPPDGRLPGQYSLTTPADLGPAYDRKLRKREASYVFKVDPQSIESIENRIFLGAYKGITDFVTKYLWPLPARWATRQAVRLGFSPNHVTALSLVLVFVAIWLFMEGHFAAGLIVGWLMTFLDTVDGKLARVTLTSSYWGNIFDHGIDLVHPPFWYLAWWYGLHHTMHDAAGAAYWDVAICVIFIGYIVCRLEERLFLKTFNISIHVWRPIDAFFRLITARRNPNLAILTIAILFGAPSIGLLLVAAWTLVSVLFHAIQIIQAWVVRRNGQLLSYLAEPIGNDAT